MCSSCGREVEATVGECPRCGHGQAGPDPGPGPVPAEDDSQVAAPQVMSLAPRTVDEHIYLELEIAPGEVCESPGAAAPDAAQAMGAAAAEPAETEAGEADGDDGEEKGGLRAAYRARRVRIKDLNTPALRWLLWIAVAQIVIVAILMTVQKVRQPQVNSGVPGASGGTFVVPLAVFVVMGISLAAGYWFGLAGALRVRAGFGVPIAALATWALADGPISSLRLGGTSVDPQLSYAGLRWAQLGVLAVFWIWLSATTVARRRAQLRKPVVAPDPAGEPWRPGTVFGALACVLAYYALELVIWVLYARAGLAAIGTGSLLEDLGVQAVLLPVFLALVVLLGSTDLLEWGEIGVRWVTVRAQRAQPPALLMILTPLVAVAMIANVVRLDRGNVLLELAVVGVPVVLAILLVRLAPGYGDWSGDIRSRAVITGAAVIFLYITILLAITSAIRSAIGWSFHFDSNLYWLVGTTLALAALTVGVFLLASPGVGQPEQRGRGLVLVIAGVLILIAGLPGFLHAAGLPAVFPRLRFSLLSGLQLVAALGALGWLISLAMRKRMSGAAVQLASVLGLLVGLQIVSWIIGLLNAFSRLGADSDYLLAAVFFLPVFWGFATSGDNLTGPEANTAAYPRDGRILLTVSYTLISDATLLYLGALRAPGTGKGPEDYLTADPVTPFGLVALGSALVIVAFVARMNRRSQQAAVPASALDPGAGDSGPATESPGEPRARAPGRGRGLRAWARSYSAAQVGIAAAGVLATGAALVIFGHALPGLAQANAVLLGKRYVARVPGPGCDKHGALWAVTPGEPITTTCLRSGLRVEIRPGPNIDADVKFLPPNGFDSENYRISVKVFFSKGFDGCAGFFTRASAAGRYFSAVCGDGSVDIVKFGDHGISWPYLNFTGRALTYTITAVSQGTDQSVYVDGAKLGTIVDAAFSKTEYVGLGVFGHSRRAESLVFKGFSFTPLPASARA
jgi:hypothetical protein